ncbi:MAG: hypothetical protein ACR2P7_05115, partial [bacterium]
MPTESPATPAAQASAEMEMRPLQKGTAEGATAGVAADAPERTERVKVSIMRREYTVACAPEEQRGVA